MGRMQQELLGGFQDEYFQASLKEIRSYEKTDPRKFRIERQKLFLTVQGVVFPKYGFTGDQRGVFLMMKAFNTPELNSNAEFTQIGNYINYICFGPGDVPPGAQSGTFGPQ